MGKWETVQPYFRAISTEKELGAGSSGHLHAGTQAELVASAFNGKREVSSGSDSGKHFITYLTFEVCLNNSEFSN